MTIESGRIQFMFHNPYVHPGIRLAMALLASVALHLAVIHLPDYFSMAKPLPPKPENWKFNVAIAPKGEAVLRRVLAETIEKKPVKREALEFPKPALEVAAPKERVAEMMPLSVMQQPSDASNQAEAMAGAVANLANMQFLLGQMRTFYAVTHAQIKSGINANFAEEAMKQYTGAVCVLKLEYAEMQPAYAQKVDCGDQLELAASLATGVKWSALPQPEKYFLPHRSMKITLWFEGFQVRIGLRADD